MKKSNFVALILGTIGVVFFALGMCMGLLPEWGMFRQGVVCGVIGLVILLLTVLIWRKMEGKAPIKLRAKTVGAAAVGVLGALLLAGLYALFNDTVLPTLVERVEEMFDYAG